MARDYWFGKKVFVTGGTGLLGSWLTQALIARGADVTLLVRDWVPFSRIYSKEAYKRANLVHGCVEDITLLERVVNENEIDTVFHLAAQTIVDIAVNNPLSTWESNIRGTWNILEVCRRVGGVRRLVVASSDKAYGSQEQLPYNEDHPMQGTQPYDASKSCADLIARSYHSTYGIPVCVTRCGNFYGGGDLNFNRLVPGTIRAILRGERPVIRSNGLLLRDYLYIKDAVLAYLLLAEKMDTLPIHGQAFNFGNGSPLTVLDMVKRILILMGREHIEPVILERAANEIPQQFLSIQKAGEVLGWQPGYSLEQGLVETISWYMENYKDDDPWI